MSHNIPDGIISISEAGAEFFEIKKDCKTGATLPPGELTIMAPHEPSEVLESPTEKVWSGPYKGPPPSTWNGPYIGSPPVQSTLPGPPGWPPQDVPRRIPGPSVFPPEFVDPDEIKKKIQGSFNPIFIVRPKEGCKYSLYAVYRNNEKVWSGNEYPPLKTFLDEILMGDFTKVTTISVVEYDDAWIEGLLFPGKYSDLKGLTKASHP